MSENVEGTLRRTRRFGVIVGLVVMAGALTGCSSSADDSADYAAPADAGNDVVYQEAAAADEGTAPRADNRSVITTGYLYMTVEDPIAAADEAVDIVQDAGGRIDARNETAPGERDGGAASLTLRIPSDDLDAVVDDLRELGTVDEFSTSSYDVTIEVTDLEAKISTLQDSTDRIQALLADATTISDIIYLESELAGRQAELQSLEAQQRGLDDAVSMSTIDLSLTTEPIVVVKEEDGPDSFWDGLVSGWNGLVGFISVALVILGVLLPWLALIAVVVGAIILPIRRKSSRAARRASAQVATGSMPPPPPAA